LLTKAQAAAYCGVCASIFNQACPVSPVYLLDRIPRYDRFALDEWISGLGKGSVEGVNPILQAWDMDSGNDGYDRAGPGN
jgi:hypothetical protein